MFAVVIISQIVQEFARVGKDQGRQLLWIFNPLLYKSCTALKLRLPLDK